ncbi:hypothetical protein ES708_29610 [subsurface metagenome]
MKQLLQTICVIIVTVGIVVEAIHEADIGFVLITAGSLVFAVSTKIENRVHKKAGDQGSGIGGQGTGDRGK